jgi:hypothetical protein
MIHNTLMTITIVCSQHSLPVIRSKWMFYTSEKVVSVKSQLSQMSDIVLLLTECMTRAMWSFKNCWYIGVMLNSSCSEVCCVAGCLCASDLVSVLLIGFCCVGFCAKGLGLDLKTGESDAEGEMDPGVGVDGDDGAEPAGGVDGNEDE